MLSAYTCWSTVTGARATNYGVRIDYIFADIQLTKEAFSGCVIRPDIEGSDHCPVKATLTWVFVPGAKCPPLCSKFLPEFAGKQQKLSSFFTKLSPKKSRSDPSSVSSSYSSSGLSQETVSEKDSDVGSGSGNSGSGGLEKIFLKRSSSTDLQKPHLKKAKSDSKKSSGVAKQGSLLNFFTKPKSSTQNSSNTNRKSEENPKTISTSNSTATDGKSSSISDGVTQCTKTVKTESKPSQAQTWKSLLKGPPPAPVCKGHKEPCVLRTVKKESLNKGRQFYVCCRPEGHKNNPEARCDHFEWVEKKKK